MSKKIIVLPAGRLTDNILLFVNRLRDIALIKKFKKYGYITVKHLWIEKKVSFFVFLTDTDISL